MKTINERVKEIRAYTFTGLGLSGSQVDYICEVITRHLREQRVEICVNIQDSYDKIIEEIKNI